MKADNEVIKQIQDNGWLISKDLWQSLSDYSKQFMIDELTGFGSYKYYEQRIKSIGFTNRGTILDAACGNAQWSVVMAKKGNQVHAIDINEETIAAAKAFVKLNGASNVNLGVGSMDNLSFANETFDGIVCYSAIMYTDYDATLREFHRVLKKGGLAYISSDSFGWLVHLLVDKGLRKLDITEVKKYARRIYHRVKNERNNKTANIVVTRAYFRKLIEANGFRLLAMTPEGKIDTYGTPPPSRYPEKYYGFNSILDVLIEKT